MDADLMRRLASVLERAAQIVDDETRESVVR